MKIQLLSDLHLEFGDITNPQAPDADVVVLAGDIWTGTKAVQWILDNFTIPVVYICGNHEFYNGVMPNVIADLRNLTANTNISFLEKDAVIINGVRFLGTTLWTDFNLYGKPSDAKLLAGLYMNDYRRIQDAPGIYLTPRLTALEHGFSVDWLERELSNNDHPTVVVTHHGPTVGSIAVGYRDDQLSPSYASDLTALFEEYDIALWCHGHTHVSLEYELHSSRVVCNPRGYHDYETNYDFDVHKIIEI